MPWDDRLEPLAEFADHVFRKHPSSLSACLGRLKLKESERLHLKASRDGSDFAACYRCSVIFEGKSPRSVLSNPAAPAITHICLVFCGPRRDEVEVNFAISVGLFGFVRDVDLIAPADFFTNVVFLRLGCCTALSRTRVVSLSTLGFFGVPCPGLKVGFHSKSSFFNAWIRKGS
jgi:hypothetical protein